MLTPFQFFKWAVSYAFMSLGRHESLCDIRFHIRLMRIMNRKYLHDYERRRHEFALKCAHEKRIKEMSMTEKLKEVTEESAK